MHKSFSGIRQENLTLNTTQVIRSLTVYICFAFVDLMWYILLFSGDDHPIGRRSQDLRVLRRRSAAERLLGSWVRIPSVEWMFVLYSVCVVRYRSLRGADPSSRGVLPTVVSA
jgi:hypothetical protein